MIEFLEDNGDISVTKFLQEHGYDHDFYSEEEESEFDEDENALLSNSQDIEKNARKKGKKKKSRKSKSPIQGGPGEDVVFVEFLET